MRTPTQILGSRAADTEIRSYFCDTSLISRWSHLTCLAGTLDSASGDVPLRCGNPPTVVLSGLYVQVWILRLYCPHYVFISNFNFMFTYLQLDFYIF
jgi:hypothetical protein